MHCRNIALSSLFFLCMAQTTYASSIPPAFLKADQGDLKFIESFSDQSLPISHRALQEPTDCRAHIKTIMCLLPKAPEDKKQPPQCLDGGAAYSEPFETLYDHFPSTLQQMFCSLKVIYVLEEFFGTAYAGQITNDKGEVVGAQMGIRKSVLDEKLDLQTWASWKEQLSFGGVKDSYAHLDTLPLIQTTTQSPVNDFLYFVVAHEFGHMFDFANDLNKTTICNANTNNKESPPPPCPFPYGTWGSLTWENPETPRSDDRFPYRRGLCFYTCNGEAMTRVAVPELYSGLIGSGFISTYAASNPFDDFADSLAYYLMDKNLGTTYEIDTRQGKTYNIMAKLKSGRFEHKYKYIEKFLERTDLVYP